MPDPNSHRCITTALSIAALLALVVTHIPTLAETTPRESIVILSSGRTTYRIAADAMAGELERQGYSPLSVEMAKHGANVDLQIRKQQLIDAHPIVVAAAGKRAAKLAHETLPNVPVVYFMVPNVLDSEFASDLSDAHFSGLTTDIDPRQQIQWLKTLYPSARRIAILFSPRTARTVKALSKYGAAFSIEITLIKTDKNDFPNTIDRLNAARCDGVLMIPDAAIYNSATVQRLLLWGVRNKKAVISFSGNIVKAGALAGQFPDYKDLGRQAAEIVLNVANGKPPPPGKIQYPRTTNRAINEHTAKMIGVSLRGIEDKRVIRFGNKP